MTLLLNPTLKVRPPSISFSTTTLRSPPPPFICCHASNYPRTDDPKISIPSGRKMIKTSTHLPKPFGHVPNVPSRGLGDGSVGLLAQVGGKQMLFLCGLGYWLQGFRCFPWLALNFHMAQALNLDPSTLQLVQFSANLPMVAKPFYGVLSDAVYFGDAHRLPYISFGVFMQLLSWGTLALMPVMGTFPAQMACILLSNFGASVAEVASDALVAEFSKRSKMSEFQSYVFMAVAAGGILGNLSGGLFLQHTTQDHVPHLLILASSTTHNLFNY